MKDNKNQYFFILTAVVALSLCMPPFLQAKPLNLFGSWKGYFQGSDDDTSADGLTQFRQMYSVSWAPLITRQMTFSANMGYSHNWLDDLGTREMVNPSMQFSVRNDLFGFSLNGTAVKNNISFREDDQSSGWDSNLSSAWTNYLWPDLSLRMGQRFEETVGRDSGSGQDSTYSYIGSSVTWEVYKFKLFYDYSLSRHDDDFSLDSTQRDVEGHLAKLEYSDNFWNNRFLVNFSQLVYANKLEFSSTGDNSLLQVPVRSAYSGVDVTPSFGVLPLNQALINGNRTSPAITVQLQQPVNLALRTSFNRVDKLYVYTTRDDKLLVVNTDAVTWDLYTSGDGISWQMVAANVSSSFNTTEFRFEVSTGTVRAEYMKLVVTGWLPALDLEITELEAYSVPLTDTTGNYERDSRNYKTSLSLAFRPLDDTSFNYNFSWDRNEDSGTDQTVSDQYIQSARLSWNYSQYFAPSAGFSSVINRSDNSAAIDTETRSYDLRVSSTPIPTIDLGLSFSWSESYEDEERTNTNNHISLSTLAALYPDLSAELTVGYNQSQSDITDNQRDGVFVNFIMHSQPRKTINIDLQTSYSVANSDTIIYPAGHVGHGAGLFENTSSDGGETSLTMNWRPSDVLSFGLRGYTLYGGDIDSQYGYSFNTSYLAFRTSKTNLTLSYRLNGASEKETINNFGWTWGWDISNYFTLHASGNYLIMEDKNSWNIYSQLTTRF